MPVRVGKEIQAVLRAQLTISVIGCREIGAYSNSRYDRDRYAGRSPPTPCGFSSCAGLQSRQLPADVGSAGGDQAVVADQLAEKLVKIGAKGVLHGRWPKPRCQGDCSMRYCGRSGNYGHSYHRRLREPSMVMLPRAPDGRSASKARPVRAAQGAGRLSEPRFY
jgi:hypothetical protein